MSITARKHAWLGGDTPGHLHRLGLYATETVLLLSWTMLLDSLFMLLSGSLFLLLPVSYLLACMLLAAMEHARGGTAMPDPQAAFGLAEVRLDGGQPTQWQSLVRLLLTPPLLLALGLAFLPVPGRDLSLLQLLSGTRMVHLREELDTRPASEVQRARRMERLKVAAYAFSAALFAALVLLAPRGAAWEETDRPDIGAVAGMSAADARLLAGYLELSGLYPDSLEYHVRLASLYWRNDMHEDLRMELLEIARLDPYHPMLLLAEDLSVSIEDLQPGELEPDTTAEEPETVPPSGAAAYAPAAQDSIPPFDADTMVAPPDTAVSTGAQPDTSAAVVPPGPDTLRAAGDADPETTPADTTGGPTAGSGDEPATEPGAAPPSAGDAADPPEPGEGRLEPAPAEDDGAAPAGEVPPETDDDPA